MPAYMARFRCKCADCRSVCCHGWRIHLTKTEYLRLTALPCSVALRKKIEAGLSVFDAPTDDAFAYIAHGADNRCPMLSEAGLCSLQTECGIENQPAVCRLYPRAVRAGDPVEAVCAGSCEATVEMLMEEPSPLPFTSVTGEITSDIPPHEVFHEEERALRMKCLSLISKTGDPLPERIKAIGEELGIFVGGMTDADVLSLTRTLLLAFGREGNSISAYAKETLDALSLRDGVTEKSLCAFRDAFIRFRDTFPEADRWFDNLLTNHFYFMQFPPRDLSHAEAFTAMHGVCAMLFVLTVMHCSIYPTKEAFADTAAAVFRRVEHSNFYEIAPHLLLRSPGKNN